MWGNFTPMETSEMFCLGNGASSYAEFSSSVNGYAKFRSIIVIYEIECNDLEDPVFLRKRNF